MPFISFHVYLAFYKPPVDTDITKLGFRLIWYVVALKLVFPFAVLNEKFVFFQKATGFSTVVRNGSDQEAKHLG